MELPKMEDFEKLGFFYLGREYDIEARARSSGLVLYDSRDLTTHGVCVGMTGSGKTGLCICLLEEAAMDGVPSIVIDPKGDITNLLLTFPDLKKEDFLPWVNAEDAARKGLSVEEYAVRQAEQWRKGLLEWGQDGGRIRRLRESCTFAVFTPGSAAGIPVSILKSFELPPRQILEDEELLNERVSSTVTSLLGLIGVEGDPLRSREHILLSTIISDSWRKGSSLDLAALISQVQSPKVRRVGVMELETFFPSKDRFSLAMKLNSLLASPGLRLWFEGVPMDIGSFLYDPGGKPRVSIFYIAHLGDAERMLFVSLLLNSLVGWMRTQSGTTSLRALLYIDEVFGYLPPVANPPSKAPLMTLLKQARAFGLGVLLATQNPMDLDYKALSNAGTWFIGRLQTERDKLRILEALETVSGASGAQIPRGDYDRMITGLEKRVFLMHNVHDRGPVVFETRWAMSYLRGPLTREQIKLLMDPIKAFESAARESAPVAGAGEKATARVSAVAEGAPALPPEIPQFFVTKVAPGEMGQAVYVPSLLGIAQVRYSDAKSGVSWTREVCVEVPITDDPIPVDWGKARELPCPPDLERSPPSNSMFAELPKAASNPKNYAAWEKGFAAWLQETRKLELFVSPSLGETSKLGESESDFRIRMQLLAREVRDREVDKIRKKYAPKLARLEERIRKAKAALEREELQAKEQKYQAAISAGSALLGALLGRKAVSGVKTTARDLGRTAKQEEDVKGSRENLESLQRERAALERELESEINALEKFDPLTERLYRVAVTPKKGEITVRLVALVWSPIQ
ncbi:MAG: ATP-binding protein [Candidatus Verstraetearchaeota archaeon]|nr:ATP-binding protein [Candidatus Verstraetearchaeota archaeon]